MTTPRGAGRAAVRAVLLAGAMAMMAQAVTAAPRPPNLKPDVKTDEGGLWLMSERAENGAKASGELEADPAMTAYLKAMACKLAPEYCGEMRLYVMDRPYFNASMAPNGYMEVWSGLLLRAEDESEVAFVLGHEITHFSENHSVKLWRTLRARSNAAFVFSVVAAAAGIPIVGNLAYLGAIASAMKFSRTEETEADALGFQRATAAGYDPSAGSALWRYLVDETAQSDFDKTRKALARGSIFADHPITVERIAALDGMAKGLPAGRAADRKAYRAMIRPHLGEWLREDLRRRDYGESLYLIGRLSKLGEDMGLLNYYRGEALRLRRGAGDDVNARGAYELAVTFDDAPPAAWRELGDLYVKNGDKAKAKAAYEGYLAHAPDAQDRWLVEASLKKLSDGGAP